MVFWFISVMLWVFYNHEKTISLCIFEELDISDPFHFRYVPPIELDNSRLSLELPDSPTAIEEELGRQENVLNNLHAELNSGVRDEE